MHGSGVSDVTGTIDIRRLLLSYLKYLLVWYVTLVYGLRIRCIMILAEATFVYWNTILALLEIETHGREDGIG